MFAEKNASNETLSVGDIVFRREIPGFPQPIYGVELGGPQVGRGCGGRGIISGFDVLEKLGIFKWDIDIILMDFLGDVVCGGFATPLARSLSEEVILVTSNDRQSIFTANNICQANNYFKTVGGQSRLLGLIVNRDDGSGTAEKYARAAGISVLMNIPYNSEARQRDDSFDLAVKLPEIGNKFRKLATEIIENNIAPCEAAGLDFKRFIRLFGEVSEERPVPATENELFGKAANPTERIGRAEPTRNAEELHMDASIEKLPKEERRIYIMAEREGKTPREIADRLGSDEETVRRSLAKARKLLKKLFFEG